MKVNGTVVILSDSLKRSVVIIQLLLMGLYFPLYYYISIYVALIFALLFVVADIFTWKLMLKLYRDEENFLYISLTIFGDMFAIVFMFASAYELTNSIEHGSKMAAGLWEHVYFSIVTFTTLGYGDYVPTGNSKIIAAIQAIYGFVYFAFIIGVIGSLFYSEIEKT